MKVSTAVRVFGFSATLSVLGGCASTPAYNAAFAPKSQIAGNSQQMAGSEHAVFRAVLATLTSHGFTIESADFQDGLVSALGHAPDPHDADVTYKIKTTVTVTPMGPDRSSVGVAATQTKVMHQKTHTYFHLLWLLPIFPTGTQYNTVDRGSGVIRNAAFYKIFFADVAASLKQIEGPAPVLRPVQAAPAISMQPLAPVAAQGAPVVAPVSPGANTAPASSAPSNQAAAGVATVATSGPVSPAPRAGGAGPR